MKSKKKFSVIFSSHTLCLLIIIFFTYSCERKLRDESLFIVNDFPKNVNLQGNSIKGIRSDFYPFQMGLLGDILVFCDWENSPHFHVYQLPEFAYAGSFGQQGRGPGEFLDPLFWGQFEQHDSKKMWVYQMNTKVLSQIDINESLHTQNYESGFSVAIPPETHAAVNIISLNDSIVLGSGFSTEGEFFRFNHKNQKLIWQPFKINYTRRLTTFFKENLENISILKQGVVKIKPDKTRFVKTLAYVPVIDVYHVNGDHEFSIILKDFYIPDFHEGEFKPNTRVWYENVFLTDYFIYALNRNCNLQHYQNDECNDIEIHVFDWNGEPVLAYQLNEGIAPASPFVVDEERQKIYTVNFKNSEEFVSFFNTGTDSILFK